LGLDLAVYNSADELVLLVEVKTKLKVSSEWAARLRRNILAHGTLPKSKFFLLALPDKFYLWKDLSNTLAEIEPTYTIDAQSILAPYFEQAGVTADQISGESFELIIASWLSEIAHSNKRLERNSDSQNWLIESGLYTAIAGGRIWQRFNLYRARLLKIAEIVPLTPDILITASYSSI
jgi:hypothetical protein